MGLHAAQYYDKRDGVRTGSDSPGLGYVAMSEARAFHPLVY